MGGSKNLCIYCKGGKNLCGLSKCPLLGKLNIQPKVELKFKKEFFGPSTSIFVGHKGYPKVFTGVVAALNFKDILDKPPNWFGMDYSEIIELRSSALRTKQSEHIKSKSKLIEDNKLIAMSSSPVEIESKFKKIPEFKFSFEDISNPFGASAILEEMKITSNVKIPHQVEYVLNDKINSVEQISILSKSFDNYYLSNLLSSGAMGNKIHQKMVPTRWSITAVDDILARQLMKNIRTFKEIEKFMVFESKFLFNQFVILLMPGKWEYEDFEAWEPGSFWSSELKESHIVEEYEPYEGRTSYAEKEGGGYYATRLPVCEYLNSIKRQARVVVFREIYKGYVIPVGVWQCRENVRNAFKHNPLIFQDIEDALSYCRTKLKINLNNYLKTSKILRQKRIFDFN